MPKRRRTEIMSGEASKPKCQFYLAHKKRNCKFDAVSGKSFCGNHLFAATGAGTRRTPCTIDPTHDVAEGEMEAHLRTCPTRLRVERLQAQSYYKAGCNAGPGSAVRMPGQESSAKVGAQRAAHARAIGLPALLDLVSRVEAAHKQACPQKLGPAEELAPPEAPLEQRDKERPFSIKHARQQASIVGHMRRRGLLEDAAECAYLEFGAGAGFLTSMLADCCEARDLVLIDSGSFRLKADRALRHLNMTRVRIGIEDLWLGGLPLFAEKPNDAAAATAAATAAVDGTATEAAAAVDVTAASAAAAVTRPWVALGKHLCGAASDFTLRCAQQCLDSNTGSLRGLCIATCCHHRCSWQHYVNQPFFEQHSFSPVDFELISWMTGWALCGHEAPAGAAVEEPSEQSAVPEDGAPQQAGVAGAGIPRPQRITIGQKCKALIDQGRLLWLQECGFQAETVIYVSPDVSGENKLLIALMPK